MEFRQGRAEMKRETGQHESVWRHQVLSDRVAAGEGTGLHRSHAMMTIHRCAFSVTGVCFVVLLHRTVISIAAFQARGRERKAAHREKQQEAE